MSTVIHSARMADGDRLIEDAWVRFDGDRVLATGTGDAWRSPGVADEEVIDAAQLAGIGAVLSPGFVDLHGHGGGGWAYDDGPEAIRAARRAHRAHGTTSAVISLVAAPLDDLARRLDAIAELTVTDPGVLGSHLEGPFLAPARRGAHDPSALTLPEAGVVAELLAAGRGTVRQVTIAPELPGAIEAIEAVVAVGAFAAVGHTEADAAQARRAFDAGATLLTHAFNAMAGLHHRAPGPVGAAVADRRVSIELVADGTHVHDDVMRILLAAAPGRVALVTDAMAAAAASDGRYLLGTEGVEVRGGVAHLAGTDVIAGSTLTQDAAVRRAAQLGLPIAAALNAATAVPARAIGLASEIGALAPGLRADAVLLDAQLEVRAVWAAGTRVV
ncbi:N-acetylglucosamine-6-phosphate deacetylase [Microbacterium sp. P05]|uniref:N-acetylglucosamine-6-phosphate deacetylase n=1 Tax=Microbacterium sp. P05 TaxID=3366948 RepID=UPI0037454352